MIRYKKYLVSWQGILSLVAGGRRSLNELLNKNLCSVLDESQCSYALSNYSPQEVRPVTADRIIEIDVTSSASGNGRVVDDRLKEFNIKEFGDRSSGISRSMKKIVNDVQTAKVYRHGGMFD